MIAKRIVCGAILAVLAGCQATPPAPHAQPPSLQLVSSQPLILGPGCEATGSVFIEFTVRTDGSTDALKLPSAPACVREALTAWVTSFRYQPPSVEVPTGVEWLLVTARRGS